MRIILELDYHLQNNRGPQEGGPGAAWDAGPRVADRRSKRNNIFPFYYKFSAMG